MDVHHEAPPGADDELVRITVLGRVELHPSLSPDEGARAFWQALQRHTIEFASMIRAAAFREAAALAGTTDAASILIVRAEEAAALALRPE